MAYPYMPQPHVPPPDAPDGTPFAIGRRWYLCAEPCVDVAMLEWEGDGWRMVQTMLNVGDGK